MEFALPAHYRVFELSQDFYLILDKEGALRAVNSAFLTFLGTDSLSTPIPITEYLSSESQPEWLDCVRAEEPTPPTQVFMNFEAKDFEATWSFYPYPEGTIAVCQPAQEASDHQAIVNAYKHMAFLVDDQGDLLAFNETANNGVGKVWEHAMKRGAPLKDFVPEAEKEAFDALVQAGLKGEKKIVTRRLTFGRKFHWLDVTVGPIENPEGTISRVLLTVQDITQRKLAEEQFKELEISYKSIFRQLAAGILLYDLDLKLIQANQGVTEILGYTSEELVKMDTFDYTHAEDVDMSHDMACKLINGELDRYSIEKRYLHKNGQILWGMLTATLVYDLMGKPKHIISVVQDISRQKRTEEDLRFKKNELDSFVYRASHDLKGPVNSLLALYNVVSMEVSEPKALEYFNHYHKNIQRLHDIIQNLLELSRIKDIKAHFKPVNVQQIVEASEDMLSHLPNYENISFRHEFDLPETVKSDHTLLSTILQNLIENAIKYSNPYQDGEVWVKVKHQESMLTIQVQDNGIGIEEKVLPKIFNMFYRATTQASGSGLGLYLLKNAVDKLEGTIDIESTYGQGTTFTIFLPTQDTPHETPPLSV